MRILLIDNYDSYAANLCQLLAVAAGSDPEVLLNDDPRLPKLAAGDFDCAVISPGPGRPEHRRDIGYCAELLQEHPELPVLGVCLGHQAIGHAAGAVVTGGVPRHGFTDRITHDGAGLFRGVPQGFAAVRYHSLQVAVPLPEALQATAWAGDGVLMALAHRQLPRWGVQFHPESVATEHGLALARNFLDLVREHQAAAPGRRVAAGPLPVATRCQRARGQELRAELRTIGRAVDGERAFTRLYADRPSAFWLDSAAVPPGRAGFSFLGDDSGPLAEALTYRAGDGHVTVTSQGRRTRQPGTIFEVLRDRLGARRVSGARLPFGLNGGYVGYLGYELKADCGGSPAWRSPHPDAMWVFADRLVVIDHLADRSYALALHDGTASAEAASRRWLDHTAAALGELGPAPALAVRPVAAAAELAVAALAGGPPAAGGGGRLARDRDRYLADIGACLAELRRGESYEICLTNTITLPPPGDPLEFYRVLRQVNPAPYAAFLRFGGLAVLSTSPESFLRFAADGTVRAKPIKGTAARHPDPAADAALRSSLQSAKNQAENLIVTDLLRNDLGRSCEPGSVAVPSYLSVESYASVHQLVSTVTGRLRPAVHPVDCVRHCFPGGSMTGAPKIRTMEILDRLEGAARGIYSGALGYFGLGGEAELAMAIRTAVSAPDGVSIGTGGAIVLESDPAAEFDEIMIKAAPLLDACRRLPGSNPRPGR